MDKRSVRDHIGVLVQRFKRKEAKELKESGISPTKTELDEAIEQIIAMEESADEQHDLEDGEKRDKMEGDRLKAEEMRRTAMETLGKTQKRKSEEGQSKAKKSRSGSETVEFLKLKAEQDMDIKKQELDLRKQEQEKMAIAQNQQTYMFNQMLKQQQEQHKQMHDMQSLLMQQQQLQTTAMMKIIETLVPK